MQKAHFNEITISCTKFRDPKKGWFKHHRVNSLEVMQVQHCKALVQLNLSFKFQTLQQGSLESCLNRMGRLWHLSNVLPERISLAESSRDRSQRNEDEDQSGSMPFLSCHVLQGTKVND